MFFCSYLSFKLNHNRDIVYFIRFVIIFYKFYPLNNKKQKHENEDYKNHIANRIRNIYPTVLGIFTVLLLLVMFNLIVHNGDAFNAPDNGFFTLLVPVTTIIALIIQFTLTLPFWENFKSRKKVWGLTLFQFTILLCIVSGLAFGLVFWERSFGLNELVFVSLTGIIAFSVYWTINLLILRQIDRLELNI